jgi:hypothetical protein
MAEEGMGGDGAGRDFDDNSFPMSHADRVGKVHGKEDLEDEEAFA